MKGGKVFLGALPALFAGLLCAVPVAGQDARIELSSGRFIVLRAIADTATIAGGTQRATDTYLTTFVYEGPHTARAEDKKFYTPGAETDGVVPGAFETAARRQRSKLALKTNLAYAATLTPNLRLEIGLGSRTTLDLAGSYNPWNLDGSAGNNRKLVHWMALAEYRYWFCERFSGHFLGVHGLGTKYNIGDHDIPPLFEKGYRYQGWGAGGGVSYGYALPIAKRWEAEFNIGFGAVYMSYDQYECTNCAKVLKSEEKFYFGPTRVGVSIGFMIK